MDFFKSSPVEVAVNVTLPLRAMFYMVSPSESSPATMREIPPFIHSSFPIFVLMLIVEIAVNNLRGEKRYAVNDVVTSMGAGVISRLPDLFGRTFDLILYTWVHAKINLFDLPVDSVFTWIFLVLTLDCLYYWFHRLAHEINILWAGHQTHHSSEYYNLSTALRQPFLGKYINSFFFVPLALVIPPPMYYAHVQLNLIYQFWIHTAAIDKCHPVIEFFFNTPSHHRVHHGRNPYCIDKNYAGFLIIWDRMFGTFEPERDGEEIHYGLIHQINSFDAIWNNVFSIHQMWRKFKANASSKKYHGVQKATNMLKAIFYGPGWTSRKPDFRLGDRVDLPEIEDDPKVFDVSLPYWHKVYGGSHFFISSAIFWLALMSKVARPLWVTLAMLVFTLSSCCSYGYIFNGKSFAKIFELLRCVATVLFANTVLTMLGWSVFVIPVKLIYSASAVMLVLSFIAENKKID